MASLNLMIDDKLDQEFRGAVVKKLGMKRGHIKKAVEEALRDWIEKS
jgi:hypothetical protein